MNKVSLQKKNNAKNILPEITSLNKQEFNFHTSLKYNYPKITYSNDGDYLIDLSQFYAPATDASPQIKCLSDEIWSTHTALAYCELTIRKSKKVNPTVTALKKAVTFYWNTILFLRSRGIYRLSDAGKDDINALCHAYAKGGWGAALNIRHKISEIISEMDRDTFIKAVNFTCKRKESIEGLKISYWKKQLGFIPQQIFTSESRESFEKKAQEFGYGLSSKWNKHYRMGPSKLSKAGMRLVLARLNNLYYLPLSVDRLGFLPFEHVGAEISKYANKPIDRTPNLGVDAAAHVLGKALDWVYDYGPKLVDALSYCRNVFSAKDKRRYELLERHSPFKALAMDLGIPEPTSWNPHRHPDRNFRKDKTHTVEQLIGALQGACAIVIAGFNARRSSEVSDIKVGLRFKDLSSDPESGLNTVNFYIEKSYQDRHLFYVNQSTADAIRLLYQLKIACAPIDGNTDKLEESPLFSCHTWSERGPTSKAERIFTFSKNRNKQRSIDSFLYHLDDEYKDIELRSHMWRRFFGLLYVYRYDHGDLQSLSQHLRHADLAQTIIYVTDTSSREPGQEIERKVPSSKQAKIKDLKLINSLQLEFNELHELISMIQKEKLGETVASILNMDSLSGGFPRLVRKLYISLSKELDFRNLVESQKAELITTTLSSRGYTSHPMQHGQCNAPTNNHTNNGKCSTKGHFDKSKASADFCQGCMYHSKTENSIKNLFDEIDVLDQDISSNATPDFIREESIKVKQNLKDVIQQHKKSSEINKNLMRAVIEKYD